MIIRPIVVGVHPKREEREAVELAVALSRMTGAPLEFVATSWFDSTPGRTLRKDFEADFARRFADVLGGSDGSAKVRINVAAGSASYLVHETARRLDAGLIVVGSGGNGGLGRMALGSTTEKVLDGAPCPVAVAPRGFRSHDGDVARVGVAFVDSVEGRGALRGAATIAAHLGSPLVAYTAVGSESRLAAAEDGLQDALVMHVDDLGVEVETRVFVGGTPDLIAASREVDLLVVGSRSYGPLRSTVLGSVSGELARHALCPVIVVPRAVDHALAGLFPRYDSLAA